MPACDPRPSTFRIEVGRDPERAEFPSREHRTIEIPIEWTIYVRAATPQKCKKAVRRIAELPGLSIDFSDPESYWKDDSVYRVGARSEFEARDHPAALDRILKEGSRLASLWLVAPPSNEGTSWEFHGQSNTGSTRIPGVDAVFVTVRADSTCEEELTRAEALKE